MASDQHDWMWSEALSMLAKAERMHQQMFQPVGHRAQIAWEPPVDVLETEQAVLVLAALPGVDVAQVEAAIEGGVAHAQKVAPADDAWETKVLASYLGADGRLAAIPASRRKRLIVLRWLARQFQPDRRYREAEVNEILQRRHWDSATLRRELIGSGMMAREAGVYWLTPECEWRGEPEGLRS